MDGLHAAPTFLLNPIHSTDQGNLLKQGTSY